MKKLLVLFSIIMLTTTVHAQKITYPVVVAFGSVCCGVPDNAPVMKFISSFKKQNKIKRIAVDHIGPMGKEGEYYLAFKLKEMNARQKVKFIEQLKKITPTMVDRGSAGVWENLVIDKAELGRAGISTKVL